MTTFILFFAALGIILVIVEILLPGMVIGILGGLSMLAAVILTFIRFGFVAALAMFAGLLITTGAAAAACFKSLPKPRSLSQNPRESKSPPDLRSLLGLEGRSLSMLRPAGKAEFDGRPVDVLSEAGLIQAGQKIRVVRVEGARVVVRQI